MAIFSKACKPDNFESHNSLKLSFTNNRGEDEVLIDEVEVHIDEVLSINPSVFVFPDFNVHHLVELIDLVNSGIIFLSQMTLLR